MGSVNPIRKSLYPCKLCGQPHEAYITKQGRMTPEFCDKRCARKWYYDNVQRPRQAAQQPPAELTQRSGRRPHKRAGKPTDRSYIDRIRACVINAKGDYRPPRSVTEVS